MRTRGLGLISIAALVVALAVAGFLLGSISSAQPGPGPVPPLIAYQGILVDSEGRPVSDGVHKTTFRIYDALSGGSPLWEEMQELTTVSGVFSTLLGSETPFGDVFEWSPLYLAVQVGGDREMEPRQLLASVPFALRAATADTLDGLDSTAFARAEHGHEGLELGKTEGKEEREAQRQTVEGGCLTGVLDVSALTTSQDSTSNGGLSGRSAVDYYRASVLQVEFLRSGKSSGALSYVREFSGGAVQNILPPTLNVEEKPGGSLPCNVTNLTLTNAITRPSNPESLARDKLFADSFRVEIDGLDNFSLNVMEVTMGDMLIAPGKAQIGPIEMVALITADSANKASNWWSAFSRGEEGPKPISVIAMDQAGDVGVRYDFGECVPRTWAMDTPEDLATMGMVMVRERLVVECETVAFSGGNSAVLGWIKDTVQDAPGFQGDIEMTHLDINFQPLGTFRYSNAFPARYTFPYFNVAAEYIELQEEVSFSVTGLELK